MLQQVGPKPLIEPEKLHTEADWIAAGKRVFDEFDHIAMRTYNPELIALARTREQLDADGGHCPTAQSSGFDGFRQGRVLHFRFRTASNCHLTYLPDGTRVPGPPGIGSPRLPTRVFVVSTGYYKVPSLKGVWYRGHYLHDGSAASLEEMFDPDRLQESHEPGGWLPVGVKTRAIPGHEFGLHLRATEREQLVAFLRTL
jgi:hypothetical protein